MKRIFTLILALALCAFTAFPALAELPAVATPEPWLVEVSPSEATGTMAALTEPVPTEPFTWQYLGTIAGAAAATLLIVQFIKAPLDRVWKIPTRVLAYVIALIIMLVAAAFTGGLTPENALLAVVNAFIAAMTAMGAYEMTFAKLDGKGGDGV